MATVDRSASLNTALLRFGEERSWFRFTDPLEAITVWELEDVVPALERAHALNRDGHWVVGLLSYDAGPAFDPAVVSQRDSNCPLLALGVFDSVMADGGPIKAHFETSEWTPDQTEKTYAEAIAAVRRYIESGDTYQVNYTLRRHATFSGSAEGFFAAMSRAQRADHDAFLHLGSHALCSASPELFFTRVGDQFRSKPMKGTRPRHFDAAIDAEIVAELESSLKDRAENVMIVDMVRNDLGRIAQIGSVHVPSLLDIETYPTVHTMTSVVTAESSVGLVAALRALYPIASITGAPKYRTTEIIAELETSPRGAYTGTVMALAPDRRWEFNVVIRSAWIDLVARQATYGVGGGILWDSDAHDEWLEAGHKSRILARAGKPLELLETMAWTPDAGVSLRQRHINRLLSAGDHFGIDVDMEQVMALLNSVRSDTPVLLRLLVNSGGVPNLEVHALPGGEEPARPIPVDSVPTDPYDEFLVFKTTNRIRYEEARARFPQAPDVILWNVRAELTETTIANLVLEIDGQLVTPHQSCGLLPGTLREELLDRGQIVERVLATTDLDSAERVFTINSVRGWDEIEVSRAKNDGEKHQNVAWA